MKHIVNITDNVITVDVSDNIIEVSVPENKPLLVKVPKTLDEKIEEKVVEKTPKVKDGKKGEKGEKWDKGEKGDKWDTGDKMKFSDLTPYEIQTLTGSPWNPWEWVPRWGTTGQILAKKTNKNFDTEWITDSTSETLVSISWDTTITETSWNYLYLIDTTLSDITINLPTAIDNTANYQFKRISSWTYEAHIVPFGTETIDTYSILDILFKNTNIPIVSDGSNWLIL